MPAVIAELLEGQCKLIWHIEVEENIWKLLQQGFASKVDHVLCHWKQYCASLRDIAEGYRINKEAIDIAQAMAKREEAVAKWQAVVANHTVSSLFNRATGYEARPSVIEKHTTKGPDGMLKLKEKLPGTRFDGMIVNISVSGALSVPDQELKIKGITMVTSSAAGDWPAKALRCTQVTCDDG